MCGICGMATLEGVDRSALEAMSAALVHRGPDSAGEMVDGPVALAARRLAIIDIPGGDQPITGADGRVTVVQNGEIYNHEPLRRGAGASRSPLPDAERYRGAAAPLRGARPRLSRASARDVRARALGSRRASGSCLPATPSGSSRCTTGEHGHELSFASELARSRASPGSRARSTTDAVEAYPGLQLDSRPADRVPCRPQAHGRATG